MVLALRELTTVWSIGERGALRLYREHGIATVAALRARLFAPGAGEKPHGPLGLNVMQTLRAPVYEDLQTRMARDEVEVLLRLFVVVPLLRGPASRRPADGGVRETSQSVSASAALVLGTRRRIAARHPAGLGGASAATGGC